MPMGKETEEIRKQKCQSIWEGWSRRDGVWEDKWSAKRRVMTPWLHGRGFIFVPKDRLGKISVHWSQPSCVPKVAKRWYSKSDILHPSSSFVISHHFVEIVAKQVQCFDMPFYAAPVPFNSQH